MSWAEIIHAGVILIAAAIGIYIMWVKEETI